MRTIALRIYNLTRVLESFLRVQLFRQCVQAARCHPPSVTERAARSLDTVSEVSGHSESEQSDSPGQSNENILTNSATSPDLASPGVSSESPEVTDRLDCIRLVNP